MATRRATTTEPDYEEEQQEEQEDDEVVRVPSREPSDVAAVDYDPFAGASEARRKFLKGEMTWREYTEAEQPPQEQQAEEQPES